MHLKGFAFRCFFKTSVLLIAIFAGPVSSYCQYVSIYTKDQSGNAVLKTQGELNDDLQRAQQRSSSSSSSPGSNVFLDPPFKRGPPADQAGESSAKGGEKKT